MAGAALEFTDSNFQEEVLQADKPVLVDFWAPWCGPCKAIGPLVDQLAKDHADRFRIGKLNVDDNQQTAIKYGVSGIPTFLVFKDGEVVSRLQGGNVRKEAFVHALEEAE